MRLAFVAFGLVFLSSIYFWLYFGKPAVSELGEDTT
jgi:hypothetical protein